MNEKTAYTEEALSAMASDIAYAGKVGEADTVRVMEMLQQGAEAMKTLDQVLSALEQVKLYPSSLDPNDDNYGRYTGDEARNCYNAVCRLRIRYCRGH